MNRRTSLRSMFLLSAIGISSLSVFRLCSGNDKLDVTMLRSKKDLLAKLADTIIPRTATPGASDAGVEYFIMNMIENCTERKSQQNFIGGLIELEEYSLKYYKLSYLSCSEYEQIEILKYFEEKSVYPSVLLDKINYKLFGKPFFTKLKELTVEGYCTSQIGATKGLRYDFNPGTFNGCIPLTSDEKSWATK